MWRTIATTQSMEAPTKVFSFCFKSDLVRGIPLMMGSISSLSVKSHLVE